MKPNGTAKWTEEQANQLKAQRAAGERLGEIAKSLGRTRGAVSSKLDSLPLDEKVWLKRPAVSPKTTVEIPGEADKLAYWRNRARQLEGDISGREAERTATEILVDEVMSLAPKSYNPAPATPQPVTRGTGAPQSAVLMFSDTHIGQIVTEDQTLGLGNYSFDIFLRRLARLERSVASILMEHTTSGVSEIVVAMLGDLLHGALVHSVEAGQVNTLFSQFYSAGHAIAQFLRNLSTLAPLRIYTAVGNHPRWQNQHKMPTSNRFSNLDQFLAAYVQALLKDCPRVVIHLDKQPFARFAVQGWQFLAGHGDHLRGGDKNLGIPNHAIGRNVQVHSQLALRAGQPIPNYFLVGHLHRPITLPTTLGEFIVNGGFPGLDGFALMEAFNSSHPSQKFFLVHPKFGRSATYDIRLDLGDGEPHHYTLPGEFVCL